MRPVAGTSVAGAHEQRGMAWGHSINPRHHVARAHSLAYKGKGTREVGGSAFGLAAWNAPTLAGFSAAAWSYTACSRQAAVKQRAVPGSPVVRPSPAPRTAPPTPVAPIVPSRRSAQRRVPGSPTSLAHPAAVREPHARQGLARLQINGQALLPPAATMRAYTWMGMQRGCQPGNWSRSASTQSPAV